MFLARYIIAKIGDINRLNNGSVVEKIPVSPWINANQVISDTSVVKRDNQYL